MRSDYDHRQLGKSQDLFMFSDAIGKGLPIWLEKGAIIRRQLENFIVEEEIKRGYSHVYTPDIAHLGLYKTSGHYPYYKDSMYAPIDIDGRKFMLRPMTCPHHFQIYKRKPRTYNELPIRLAELAKLYRYEQSGELSGLSRVMSFTLADAHIICRPDQVQAEIQAALILIDDIAKILRLQKYQDYWYRLSLGDKQDSEKYFKDDKAWEQAEAALRSVLQSGDNKFTEAKAEAAFYGPKIDIQMRNNRGQEETAFTVQYDFVMPKRFQLTYTDKHNKPQEAVVIHRSSIGAVERIMAFLIEFYQGNFPVWLSPYQIKILTISNDNSLIEGATALQKQLQDGGIRVALDTGQKNIGQKKHQAEKEAVPYLVAVGHQELETGKYTVATRSDLKPVADNHQTLTPSEIINHIQVVVQAYG